MSALPSGIVTLLFIEIEPVYFADKLNQASDRLALNHCNRLLAQTLQEENGTVFQNTCDAIHAAFSNASAAVRAAGRVQFVLHDLAKNGGAYDIARCYRAAVHTGLLAGSGAYNDYPLLSQIEAHLKLGHGEQILVSDSTYQAVHGDLPRDVSFEELGLFSMNDRTPPDRVWQIRRSDLPSQSPEIRADVVSSIALTLQTTAFIGRKRELTELKSLLGQHRLVTLTGPEGIGKTRLAMEVSWQLLDAFPDGVWSVSLAALSDASHIAQAATRVFGLRDKPNGTPQGTLIQYLANRRLLLVCDHYDNLTSACSEFIRTLLNHCPHIRILATGQDRLDLAEERAYPISALILPPLPESSDEQAPPYTLVRYESIRLFLDRARQRQPGFSLAPTGAAALCRLCHRLNGTPLALELAASRIGSLTVEQISSYLANFYLISNPARSPLPYPWPLQVILDWTFALLGLKEQILLLRLSVFPESWTIEAAEAICSDSMDDTGEDSLSKILQHEIPAAVNALTEKSLVLCFEREGQSRCILPEAIRSYAQKRLHQTEEAAWIRDSHCSFFFQMAQEAHAHLKDNGRDAWTVRLECEVDNIRKALKEALDAASAPALTQSPRAIERLLLFTGSLEPFWRLGGYTTDGRHYLAAALAFPAASESSQARVFALNAAATLARAQHEPRKADAWYQESLAISRSREDYEGIATALDNLAQTARDQGDFAKAAALLEQAIAMNCRPQRRKEEASNWNQLGSISWVRGDFDSAVEQFSEALLLHRALRHDRIIANAYAAIGVAALERSEFKVARCCLAEGLRVGSRIGNHSRSTTALLALAKLMCLEGKREWAATLFAAAHQSRDSFRVAPSPGDLQDQEKLEEWLHECLDEVNYQHAVEESETVTIDHILARLQPPNLRLVTGGRVSAAHEGQAVNRVGW